MPLRLPQTLRDSDMDRVVSSTQVNTNSISLSLNATPVAPTITKSGPITQVVTNSIQLAFNGANVNPTITRSAGQTTVAYDPPGDLAGQIVDKLLVTTDANFVPSGLGPPESGRVGQVAPPAFNPPTLSAVQATLSWTGTGNLEQTDSLSPPNWVPRPARPIPKRCRRRAHDSIEFVSDRTYCVDRKYRMESTVGTGYGLVAPTTGPQVPPLRDVTDSSVPV